MGLRAATRGDVRRIVEMLDDDEIAKGRENLADMAPYEAAFDAIAADPNNSLHVWEEGGKVVGCLQLTFIPGLSYQGAWTAQVEGVRVDRALRGSGIGARMIAVAAALSRYARPVTPAVIRGLAHREAITPVYTDSRGRNRWRLGDVLAATTPLTTSEKIAS